MVNCPRCELHPLISDLLRKLLYVMAVYFGFVLLSFGDGYLIYLNMGHPYDGFCVGCLNPCLEYEINCILLHSWVYGSIATILFSFLIVLFYFAYRFLIYKCHPKIERFERTESEVRLASSDL